MTLAQFKGSLRSAQSNVHNAIGSARTIRSLWAAIIATSARRSTNAFLYEGASFLDPYQHATFTNPVSLYFEPSGTLQFGAGVSNAIQITT
jgi:hypothetical protein